MSFLADIFNAITPSILGLGAFIVGSWFVDAILKRSDEPGVDIESFFRTIIKLLQFFGIIVGILCFAALISSPVSTFQAYNDPLTLALLGIIGFVLLIAPIAKIPWAALVGFFVAIITAAAVYFLTPPWLVSFITGYIDFKWVVLAVFIIIGLILFISLKWLEDLIKAFAMILASRPITFILMIVGIAQAILILYYPGGILHWLWPSIIPP